MSEFCLECFNKLFKKNCKKRHVVLEKDICEGCGEWKKCVVKVKRKPPPAKPKKKSVKK